MCGWSKRERLNRRAAILQVEYMRMQVCGLEVHEQRYRRDAALIHVDVLHCPSRLQPQRTVAAAVQLQ
jgi:hypothetical protein